MTVEEKIRRAEEIYERRKQGETKPVTKVTVNDKKDIKLLKKMVIQILICVSLYLMVYAIKNSESVFSEDFINKTKEILSYDFDFIVLYDKVINFKNQQPNAEEEHQQQEQEAIGGAEETLEEQESEKISEEDSNNNNKEEMSQGEIDLQNIKNTTTFIKPVEGIISSQYGQRDTATGRVPKNHTGTDIAADLGTKIISATDGEVVLASEEGDYRKTSKNSNRRGKYHLCTLQCFICKARR